jgi:fibronectin-binding autotransporter adhesin
MLFSLICAKAEAADRYWIATALANWNNTANWSDSASGAGGFSVPGFSDIAYFGADTTKDGDCSVNATVIVAGINIAAGYDGTITQGAFSITVGSTGWTQAGGTFTGSATGLTLTGNWSLSGGTFNPGSQTFSASRNMTYSGGTVGTVNLRLYGGGTAVTITGSLTLASLNCIGNNKPITIAAGTTLTVTGLLTLNAGVNNQVIDTGNIVAQGDVTIGSSGQTTGTAVITMGQGSGAVTQTLTGNGSPGSMPSLVIDTAGTINLVGTIRVAGSWTYTAGTVNAGTSTVIFYSSSSRSITGSHTLANVTFNLNNATATIAGGTTLTVAGTLALDPTSNGQSINTGNLVAQGDVTVGGSGQTTGTVVLTMGQGNGAVTQTLTGSATGLFPSLIIDSAGTINLVGDVRVSGSWTYTAGTVVAGTSTVQFKGAGTITGSHTLANVTFGLNGTTATIAGGTTLTVSGLLNLSPGGSGQTINGGDLVALGDVTGAVIGSPGTTTITLGGANNQTITKGAGTFPYGTWTVNKTGGVVSLAAALSLNGAGQDLDITAGTLSLGGYNLTVNDQFTIGASGTLRLQGGETISKAPTANSGTVQYTGDGAGTAVTLKNWTYASLDIASTTGTPSTFSLPAALTLSGNLSRSGGTLDATASNYDISLGGNWLATGGSFTARAATVTLAANTSHTITGSTTFNNLSHVSTAADTLTFEAGSTQTIAGTLTLQGASGQVVSLRSSTPGTKWNLDAQGTRTLAFLDVMDSNSTNATVIDCRANGSVDSGNNVRWMFTTPTAFTWTGATDSNFNTTTNWYGGAVPISTSDVVYSAVYPVDCTVNANANVKGITIEAGYAATITQGAFTITVGSTGWTQAGGTFTGSASAITLNGPFALSGGTFNAGSQTIVMNGSVSTARSWTYSGGTFTPGSSTVAFWSETAGITITGSQTFNNLSFYGVYFTHTSNITISAGTTVTATGTLLFDDGAATSNGVQFSGTGTIAAQGHVTAYAPRQGYGYEGTVKILINGTGNQTFTSNAGTGASDFSAFSNIEISKASGTLTLVGSMYVKGNVSTAGTWTYTQGTIDPGTSTIRFQGDNGGLTITGSHTLANVTFQSVYNTRGNTMVLAAGTTLTTTGTLTFESKAAPNNKTITLNGGAIAAQGNLNLSMVGNACLGTTSLSLTGTANQQITFSGTDTYFRINPLTINKTGGTASLASNLSMNFAGQDLAITQGTLALAGYNLTVNDQFTVGASGVLELQGGETVTGGPDTLSAGSTVRYVGTSGPYTVKDWSYQNLTFNGAGGVFNLGAAEAVAGDLTLTAGTFDISGYNLTVTGAFSNAGTLRLQGGETTVTLTMDTDSGTVEYDGTGSYAALKLGNTYNSLSFTGSGTWQHTGALDVNGNLAIASGATLNSAGQNIALAGNWSNGGTYTPGANTVTLDGTDQSISGSTSFAGLSKIVAATATLTCEAGATQTVTGTLTLQGASGNRLLLRSSISDTPWLLASSGSRSCTWLDVKDGTSLVAPRILPSNSLDSLGNLNWFGELLGLCWGPGTTGAADGSTDAVPWSLGSLSPGTTRTSGEGADAATTFAVRNVSAVAVQLTATAGSSGWTIAALPGADRCWLGIDDGPGPFTSLDSTTSPSGVVLNASLPASGVQAFNLRLITPLATATTGTTTLTVTLTASPP